MLIVASAVVGAVGWQQLTPKPMSPTTVMITPTTTASVARTTVTHRETEWIRIDKVRPVNYYLELLLANGTSPYGQLYWELRKLPDLTNATAVAKITYLALNATNPEVREAFELVIKGGTPYPGDFKYLVPSYNTELQVLYWLACQNEFKRDDTLALATCMVNGLWVTMGDEQVRQAVKRDANEFLIFFRGTSELQRGQGHPLLEDYPLEAKICLAWRANNAGDFWSDTFSLTKFASRTLQLNAYEWATVSLATLRQMRDLMEKNRWVVADRGSTVANLEDYFYFGNHWNYTYTTYLSIDSVTVRAVGIHNVDWQFRYYLQTGKGIGTCGDEADLVDAFCKSWGIATTFVWRRPATGTRDSRISHSHMYVTYYDPVLRSWGAYHRQADAINMKDSYTLYVTRPPVLQPRWLNYWKDNTIDTYWYGNMYYIANTPYLGERISTMFKNGVPTVQIKQWLFYNIDGL